MSLPLRLESSTIVPLGRPGRTEPDFIFFPRGSSIIPTYGVIELKKPSSDIVTVTRSNAAILSRDAETAVQQVLAYAQTSPNIPMPLWKEAPLFLGSKAHLFVIMGMSSEISSKLGKSLYREAIENRLPPNLRLIPYDTLLKQFESHVPLSFHVLVPSVTNEVTALPVPPPARWLSGEAARLNGGRWTPRGIPAVYCAGSQSLAVLERLVHLDVADLLEEYFFVEIVVDESLIVDYDGSQLPNNWRADPPSAALQEIGKEWFAAAPSPVLRVPSALIPSENDFILNPTHSQFSQLRVEKPVRFRYDARLRQRAVDEVGAEMSHSKPRVVDSSNWASERSERIPHRNVHEVSVYGMIMR
jgi:RES domain-containing protein